MELTHELTPQLKRLRLSGVLETLELRNQQAIQERLSYVEFLARLIQDEVERRAQKQLQLRVRRAAFRSDKTLESFDFGFNPTINRQQVLDLAACHYITEHRNLLVCGPTGVGNVLKPGVGARGVPSWHDVLFVSTHKMLAHLNGGRAIFGSYDRRFQTYLRPDLLILDDFGLKPVSSPGPEDLLDVILERYERGRS